MAEELQAKYQKLATAYSELKAKNGVLKKAVIDDQAKSKELQDRVAALQAQLKERDMRVRNAAQELDTLRFHNNQLSKRVEVLQSEAESKGGSSSRSSSSKKLVKAQETIDLQEEELQRRIKENEQLHRSMSALRAKHQQEVEQLKQSLGKFQTSASASAKEMETFKASQHEALGQSRRAIAELEESVRQRDTRLVELETALEELKATHTEQQREHENRYNALRDALNSKVLFDDTANAAYNCFNVPTTPDARAAARRQDILDQAGRLVKEFVASLSNLYTYLEERARLVAADTEERQDYCAVLHGHAKYIKPVERSFTAFAQETGSLDGFATACSSLSRYLSRILPHQIKNLEAQSNDPSCTPTLQSTNAAMINSLKRIAELYAEVAAHVSTLAAPAADAQGDPSQSMLAVFRCIDALQAAHKAYCAQFASKVALEHRLPSNTGQSKSTDACINSSLSKLVVCLERMGQLLRENEEFLVTPTAYATRGVPTPGLQQADSTTPVVKKLHSRATAYLQLLAREPPETIPYVEALKLRTQQSMMRQSTSAVTAEPSVSPQQLAAAKTRIAQLEQEREHFALECQLMEIKIKKLQEASGSRSLSRATSGSELSHISEDTEAPVPANGGAAVADGATPSDTSAALGQMMAQSQEAASREELIKNHYSTRISQLIEQVKFADSKAIAFHDECRNYALRLELAKTAQAKQAAELKETKGKISTLHEALETTKKNYEEQLAMMTEHVMSINDKLTANQDELDSLKRNAAPTGRRKR